MDPLMVPDPRQVMPGLKTTVPCEKRTSLRTSVPFPAIVCGLSVMRAGTTASCKVKELNVARLKLEDVKVPAFFHGLPVTVLEPSMVSLVISPLLIRAAETLPTVRAVLLKAPKPCPANRVTPGEIVRVVPPGEATAPPL